MPCRQISIQMHPELRQTQGSLLAMFFLYLFPEQFIMLMIILSRDDNGTAVAEFSLDGCEYDCMCLGIYHRNIS